LQLRIFFARLDMLPLVAALVVVVGGVALIRRCRGNGSNSSSSHRDKNDDGSSSGSGSAGGGRARGMSFNSEVMMKSFPKVRPLRAVSCFVCYVM